LPGAVRVRIALDVLEACGALASGNEPSAPRPSVREIVVNERGVGTIARTGSAPQILTLLWEILAGKESPTDDTPWSDPAGDLPDDAMGALASLSMRPASSPLDLAKRFAAVAGHTAAEREAVRTARSGGPSRTDTPVVPATSGAATIPVPAQKVKELLEEAVERSAARRADGEDRAPASARPAFETPLPREEPAGPQRDAEARRPLPRPVAQAEAPKTAFARMRLAKGPKAAPVGVEDARHDAASAEIVARAEAHPPTPAIAAPSGSPPSAPDPIVPRPAAPRPSGPTPATRPTSPSSSSPSSSSLSSSSSSPSSSSSSSSPSSSPSSSSPSAPSHEDTPSPSRRDLARPSRRPMAARGAASQPPSEREDAETSSERPSIASRVVATGITFAASEPPPPVEPVETSPSFEPSPPAPRPQVFVLPVGDPPPTPTLSDAEVSVDPAPPRRPWLLSGIAIGLVVLIGLWGWGRQRPREELRAPEPPPSAHVDEEAEPEADDEPAPSAARGEEARPSAPTRPALPEHTLLGTPQPSPPAAGTPRPAASVAAAASPSAAPTARPGAPDLADATGPPPVGTAAPKASPTSSSSPPPPAPPGGITNPTDL
jgi:hypothetical protein